MNNPSNEVINLSLTKKQCNTIIEALLFSASTDICSDWQPENMKTAVDIVETIHEKMNSEIDIKNVYVFKNDDYHDEITENIVKTLKGVIREESM